VNMSVNIVVTFWGGGSIFFAAWRCCLRPQAQLSSFTHVYYLGWLCGVIVFPAVILGVSAALYALSRCFMSRYVSMSFL